MQRLVALLLAGFLVCGHAAPRSPAIRAEFQRLNPCPVNGATRGPCPGFERDHVQPICSGGADTVDNYQWLPVAEHREKTRRDSAACKGHLYRIRAVPAVASAAST